MLKKIISGGQTGVDRAALDVGLLLHLPIGGFCPKGRWAEDGPIDRKYPLTELSSDDLSERTKKNIETSDGTLILAADEISDGTALAKEIAEILEKPCLVLDLNNYPSPQFVYDWIEEYSISTLNVAGPRESEQPGIYRIAYEFLLIICQNSIGTK